MVKNQKDLTMVPLGNRLREFRKSLGLSAQEIGDKLGINGTSVTRWETGDSAPPLSYIFYLANEFSCNTEWLLFGDCPPSLAIVPNLTVQNQQGSFIGDLFKTALDNLGISNEQAARKTGLPLKEINSLLDSRVKPSFTQLEALHLNLGINPSYFFTGNEHWMVWPDDELLRVFIAVGLSGRAPTDILVADIFDVELDEAKRFIQEWEKGKSKGRRLALPTAWLEKLQDRYHFNKAWVYSGNPPLALKNISMPSQETTDKVKPDETASVSQLAEQVARIQMEIDELKKGNKQNHHADSARERLGEKTDVPAGAPTRKKQDAPGARKE